MIDYKFILAIIVLASDSLSVEHGCFLYKNQICQACYKRKVNGTGCGQLQPDSDPCMIYTKTPQKTDLCSICKPGFAVKFNSTTSSECIQGTLKDCEIQFFLDIFGTKEYTCKACTGNKYFGLDLKSGKQFCQTVSNPAPHCLWGDSTFAGINKCFRCVDGYVIGGLSGNCDTAGTEYKGCLLTNPGKPGCAECDVFGGYSMQPDGTCLKTE